MALSRRTLLAAVAAVALVLAMVASGVTADAPWKAARQCAREHGGCVRGSRSDCCACVKDCARAKKDFHQDDKTEKWITANLKECAKLRDGDKSSDAKKGSDAKKDVRLVKKCHDRHGECDESRSKGPCKKCVKACAKALARDLKGGLSDKVKANLKDCKDWA